MQNLLYLFSKFGAFATFLILEIISIFLVVSYNDSQRSIFLNSTSIYRGEWSEKLLGYTNYFHLDDVNDSLIQANKVLMENSLNFGQMSSSAMDTLEKRYIVKAGSIVSNGFSRRNNHLVLDIGKNKGIERGMGVIGHSGLLGIVREVSDKYALINSMLHSQTKVSATVKPHLYPGSLIWEDSDPHKMKLISLPKHLKIAEGDTVITNGFSTIFPRDIVIGYVDQYTLNEGQGTYDIDVRLVNDIPSADAGFVIIDKDYKELQSLDSLKINE